MSKIETWQQRCEWHPAHQQGMVSHTMIQRRMLEEIDDLRAEIKRLNGVIRRVETAIKGARGE